MKKKEIVVRLVGSCICLLVIIVFFALSRKVSLGYLWIGAGTSALMVLVAVTEFVERSTYSSNFFLEMVVPGIIMISLGPFTAIIAFCAMLLAGENEPPCTVM